MDDYEDYSQPVHVSLMEKKLFFGIGEKAFYIIGFITLIICALTTIYAIVIGIVGILICRIICKKDPLTIDFALENLMQKDVYEG
ncbi:MAG: VirB3 family type IV secretion system protein [Treponema sp.]|nr:VirB3 family type IV secretion system protein [Treponema sp.]